MSVSPCQRGWRNWRAPAAGDSRPVSGGNRMKRTRIQLVAGPLVGGTIVGGSLIGGCVVGDQQPPQPETAPPEGVAADLPRDSLITTFGGVVVATYRHEEED